MKTRRLQGVCVGPVVLAQIMGVVFPAFAQVASNTWLNFSGGYWSDAASWSNSQIPTAAAFITQGSGYSVTQDVDVTVGTLRLWAPNSMFVVPAGRWLSVTNPGGVGGNNNNGLSLTHPSSMQLLINGGLVTNSGFHLGGTAQIIITNNGLLYTRNAGQTRIERNASLTMYSGVWDHLPALELAFDGTIPAVVANVNLLGGSVLWRGNVLVGARETAVVTINGSIVSNWADLTVGAPAPSLYGWATGVFTLASGQLIHMRNLLVGDVNYDSTNRSFFQITGGEYRNITNAAAQILVGSRSTGELHVAGGSFVATNGTPFRIGNYGHARGVGYVTNSGGTMRLSSADVRRGEWVINGGTVLVDSTLWLTNSTGSVKFTSGLLGAGAMVVSNGSAFTVGDGTLPAVLGLGGSASFANGLALNSLAALVISNSGTTAHRVVGDISGDAGVLKLGPGWMILDGNNTYSGGTTSQVGILEAVSPGALPGYNVANKVRVAANAVIAVMAGGTGQWTAPDVDTLLANLDAVAGSFLGFDIPSNSFAYGSAITGSRGLVKLGPGTLTLSGASTYTGPTFIRNGTVQLGAAHSLPTSGNLALGSTNISTEAGTFDMNGLDQRVARLFAVTLTNNVNAASTNRVINLAPGRELAVVSSSADRFVQVQPGAHLTLAGGGRLALTNTSGTVLIWGHTGTDLVNWRGLDASGLGELHADVGSFIIGFDPSSGEAQASRQAVVVLADTNTIRAATLTVAQSPRDGSIRGRLILGATNRLNVSTLRIGYDKSTGWIFFRDGFDAPSVWIAGRNPGERVNISQGEFLSLNSGTQPHGYFLATNAGSSVNIFADTWVLGTLGTNGTSATAGGRGTTIIRDGVMDVNTLIIGRSLPTVTLGSGLGWFTLLGGTMTVNSGITLAQMLGGGSDISGYMSLSGGVTTVAGNISDGGGTSTLILDGGTLDMQGNSIGSALDPINNLTMASGVLRNVGQINGGAGWAKTGSGTLTLEGTHGYGGTLTVQGGTLLYNGTYTGGGLISVQNSATLGGTGSVAGVYVASGGTLSPGLSPGVLTTSGNVTFEPGSTFEVELLGPLSGQYDQLLMANTATLTLGDATLSVIAPNPLPYGTVFPIISGWGSIDSSTFATLADGDTFVAGANTFQINYGTLSGYNDDVTLTVIPEPTTLGLLGVLGAAVLLRRRLR